MLLNITYIMLSICLLEYLVFFLLILYRLFWNIIVHSFVLCMLSFCVVLFHGCLVSFSSYSLVLGFLIKAASNLTASKAFKSRVHGMFISFYVSWICSLTCRKEMHYLQWESTIPQRMLMHMPWPLIHLFVGPSLSRFVLSKCTAVLTFYGSNHSSVI